MNEHSESGTTSFEIARVTFSVSTLCKSYYNAIVLYPLCFEANEIVSKWYYQTKGEGNRIVYLIYLLRPRCNSAILSISKKEVGLLLIITSILRSCSMFHVCARAANLTCVSRLMK